MKLSVIYFIKELVAKTLETMTDAPTLLMLMLICKGLQMQKMEFSNLATLLQPADWRLNYVRSMLTLFPQQMKILTLYLKY